MIIFFSFSIIILEEINGESSNFDQNIRLKNIKQILWHSSIIIKLYINVSYIVLKTVSEERKYITYFRKGNKMVMLFDGMKTLKRQHL